MDAGAFGTIWSRVISANRAANALTPDEVERTKEVIIKVTERRWDQNIDIHSATSQGGGLAGTPILTNLLFEDL